MFAGTTLKGCILTIFFSIVGSFCLVGTASAQYDNILVWPPHPGVFVGVPQQQFTAYGEKPTGELVDITKEVDWYVRPYPFSRQTLEPNDIAQIDADGLLTLKEGITWGRVSVYACYPKGCGAGLTRYGAGVSSPMSILLVPKYFVTPFPGTGGTMDPSGLVKVKKGTTASFDVTPSRGYAINTVDGCGGTWGGSNPFTTAAVDADCTVTATFDPLTEFVLDVTSAGTGNGTVTSDIAGKETNGINCGSGGADCSETYWDGDVVTLTAAADQGSTLLSWSGDCSSCASNASCAVTMDAAKNCTATFDPLTKYILDVTKDVAGTGTGTVTSDITGVETNGINCDSGGSDCSETYWDGDVVTLTAAADRGSTFVTWSGDCSSCTTTASCAVSMDAAKTCTAKFDALTEYILGVAKDVAGTGTGTVTSDITGVETNGINCDSGGSDCSETYWDGDVVTLTAAADAGSAFVTWSNDCASCASTGTCAVTMDAAKTCTAKFDTVPSQVTLNFTVDGGGVGGVVSNPSGITCGTGGTGTCTFLFDSNTTVTLTAAPLAGSSFDVWGGDCIPNPSVATEATVNMGTVTKNCSATFVTP